MLKKQNILTKKSFKIFSNAVNMLIISDLKLLESKQKT